MEDIINKYNKEFNFIHMVVNDFEKYLIDVKTSYLKMISKGIVIQNFEDQVFFDYFLFKFNFIFFYNKNKTDFCGKILAYKKYR